MVVWLVFNLDSIVSFCSQRSVCRPLPSIHSFAKTAQDKTASHGKVFFYVAPAQRKNSYARLSVWLRLYCTISAYRDASFNRFYVIVPLSAISLFCLDANALLSSAYRQPRHAFLFYALSGCPTQPENLILPVHGLTWGAAPLMWLVRNLKFHLRR